MDYYKISNSEETLEAAKSLLDWLTPAINSDGTIFPYWNLESKNFEESPDMWYRKKGSLHIKVSIPFVQMYQSTKDDSYLKIAKKLCDSYPKYLQNNASLSLHENQDEVNLHTLSYALEGLLFTFGATGSENYLKCCKNCLDWCSEKIEDDGSINLWFNSKHSSKSVYPIAQIIRLMLLVDSINKTKNYSAEITKLVVFMNSLQAQSSNSKIHGGFYEEFYKSMLGWKKRKKLNSWGSLFAVQSLYWYENQDEIDFSKTIWSLY